MTYCLMAMQCNWAIHHPALGQGLSLVLPLKVAGGLLRLMKCAFSEDMRGGNRPGRSTQKGWRKGVRWDYNLGSWSFGMIFHTWHGSSCPISNLHSESIEWTTDALWSDLILSFQFVSSSFDTKGGTAYVWNAVFPCKKVRLIHLMKINCHKHIESKEIIGENGATVILSPTKRPCVDVASTSLKVVRHGFLPPKLKSWKTRESWESEIPQSCISWCPSWNRYNAKLEHPKVQ